MESRQDRLLESPVLLPPFGNSASHLRPQNLQETRCASRGGEPEMLEDRPDDLARRGPRPPMILESGSSTDSTRVSASVLVGLRGAR